MNGYVSTFISYPGTFFFFFLDAVHWRQELKLSTVERKEEVIEKDK